MCESDVKGINYIFIPCFGRIKNQKYAMSSFVNINKLRIQGKTISRIRVFLKKENENVYRNATLKVEHQHNDVFNIET